MKAAIVFLSYVHVRYQIKEIVLVYFVAVSSEYACLTSAPASGFCCREGHQTDVITEDARERHRAASRK